MRKLTIARVSNEELNIKKKGDQTRLSQITRADI